MGWVIFIVVIIVIGALLGGNSLGETIREGCGFIIGVVILLIIIILIVSNS